MLNEEKIKLMSRLAMYEQGEGKKEIPMSRYFRSDYIGLHMVKSLIVVTIGYVLLIVLSILYDVEDFLEKVVTLNLIETGKKVLIGYLIFLAVYTVISYIVYRHRFLETRQGLRKYNARLLQLRDILEEEELTRKEIKAGGNDSNDDDFEF